MKRLALLVILMPTTVALAQPGSSVPPVFKIIAGLNKEKGQIAIQETVLRVVPVTVEKAVVVNGQQMTVKVTEYQYVSEQRVVVHDATKSRVITQDGKQLPIDEVWKRLTPKMVVVVSGDGKTPGQEFLRALNAETLVLILPPPTPMPLPVPEPKKP